MNDNVLLSKKKNVAKKSNSVDRKPSASVRCNARETVQPLRQTRRKLPLDRRSRRGD